MMYRALLPAVGAYTISGKVLNETLAYTVSALENILFNEAYNTTLLRNCQQIIGTTKNIKLNTYDEKYPDLLMRKDSLQSIIRLVPMCVVPVGKYGDVFKMTKNLGLSLQWQRFFLHDNIINIDYPTFVNAFIYLASKDYFGLEDVNVCIKEFFPKYVNWKYKNAPPKELGILGGYLLRTLLLLREESNIDKAIEKSVRTYKEDCTALLFALNTGNIVKNKPISVLKSYEEYVEKLENEGHWYSLFEQFGY